MKKWTSLLIVFVLIIAGCSTDSTIDEVAVNDVLDDANSGGGEGDGANGDGSDGSDDNGGDGNADDSDGTDDNGGDDASGDVSTPEPTAAPAPTAIPDPPASTALGSGDWCQVSDEIDTRFDEIDAIGFTNPQVLEETYTAALALMQQAQGAAPPQIAPAVATTINGISSTLR